MSKVFSCVYGCVCIWGILFVCIMCVYVCGIYVVYITVLFIVHRNILPHKGQKRSLYTIIHYIPRVTGCCELPIVGLWEYLRSLAGKSIKCS